MRRNGAEHIGINQQPVQAPHRLQRLHNCIVTQSSPAKPQPTPFGPLVCLLSPEVLPAMCCRYVLIVFVAHLNPTCL